MNATGIVVGGSTVKQMDCGYLASSSSTSYNTVNFNFTFGNVPKVVASPMGNWGKVLVVSCYIDSITTTGFTLYTTYSNNSVVAYPGCPVNWIAIG